MLKEGTLGLIAVEVDRTFDRAARALLRHRSGTAARDALDEARRAIGQVRGALEVADVAGVPLVLVELEQLLSEAERHPEWPGERLERGRLGLDAVRRYVSGLVAGSAQQPMALATVLQDLLAIRGSDRPAGLELFDVDLSVPLPQELQSSAAPPQEGQQDALRARRAQFQKALLTWLRGGADGLDALAGIVSGLQATAPVPAPWWVAGALIGQLKGGELSATVHVKRVFAALDQHLSRLVAGDRTLPQPLMREMLYFVSQGEAAGEQVERVRRHFGLAAMPAPVRVDQLVDVRERLHSLEQTWERAAAGDLANAQAFAATLDDIHERLPAAQRALAATLCAAARRMAGGDGTARLGLEVAVGLLCLQEALMSPQQAAAGPAHTAAALARLQQAIEAPGEDAGDRSPTPVPGGARAALAALATEQTAAMAQIEQRLAAWFLDAGEPNALADAERALTQVRGALQVLGEAHPVAAVDYCLGAIARLREPGASRDRRAQAELAAVVSALSFHAGELGGETTGFADVLRKAGGPEDIANWSPPAPSTSAPDLDFRETREDPAAVDRAAHTEDDAGGCPASDATPGDTGAAVAPATEECGADEARQLTAAADDKRDVASDRDLLAIFVDEARQVLREAASATDRLRENRREAEALSMLRRCFHTLKGSGRMVGLSRLADTAYAFERLLDGELRGAGDGSEALVRLTDTVLARLSGWVTALEAQGWASVDADDLQTAVARLQQGNDAAVDEPVAPAPEAPTVEIGGVRISRTLYDVFIDEARTLVRALASAVSSMSEADDADCAHERFRLAHTLCSISGTTGFEPIRELAGALESVLRAAHERGLRCDESERALLESAVAALAAMVDAVEARRPPMREAGLEARLRAVLQRAPALHAGTAEPGADQEDDVDAEVPAPIGPALQAAVRELAEQLNETGVLEVVPTEQIERRRLRIDDDLDASLLPAFLEEAADLVPQIGEALRAWRAQPQAAERHQVLTRLLHTFKGGARMAGAMALGELTHSMETRIATAAQLPVVPDGVFDGLEASFDRVGVLLEKISRSASPVHDNRSTSEDSASLTLPAAEAAGGEAVPAAAPATPASDAAQARALLRVRVDLLERLAMEAGELAIARARVESEVRAIRGALREMALSLGRLRTQVREMEIQAESQIQSRQVQAQGADEAMDPLEFDRFTRLQELTRMVEESAADLAGLQQALARNVDGCGSALAAQARMTRVLQDSLVSVRMVPFASLNERLYRVVRLTARDAGRRASLDVRGSRVELDRSVVDRIAAPLEHLLRNAVVHGIETPAQRRAAAKPEIGEIVLDVRQEGNEVLVTLQDDGAGFDLERLRARAVELGLLAAADTPTPEQVAQLAFSPGVSTAREVSESAGRGVGLDVVRSEVAAVGGRVEVTSEPQRGTVFTLRLPLTMTVMQTLVVRCAGHLLALPAMMVEQVRTLKPRVLQQVCEAGHVDWQSNRYPLYDLRELLAVGAGPVEPQPFTPIALVRGGAQRAAIRVDELVGHEEVVMKDLGTQLSGITGIAGAAVRGSGDIVLILNPIRLTQRLPAVPAQPRAAEVAAPAGASVLVVDDSLTVRKITGRVLARNGYRVMEARDGLEALERLAEEAPALVLLDIEMPRMDGFEVLRRLRGDARWIGLPVMMITSRTADKHRNYAMELGASAFLGKPFEEQELLAQVAELVARERA